MTPRSLWCSLVVLVIIAVPSAWAQTHPVLVLSDGGLAFPDGSVQESASVDPPAMLPQTGVRTEVTDGDDGDLRMGLKWPSPRFTDNGDGTVTDNLTDVMWLKDANCLGAGDHAAAIGQVASLNSGADHVCAEYTAGTFDDWRLPNVRELFSLVTVAFNEFAVSDSQGNHQWSEGDAFSGLQSGFYWSSTASASGESGDTYWRVSLQYGSTGNDLTTEARGIWAVRDPSASIASIVLADGGIEFPDGTVQATAVGPVAPIPKTGQTDSFASGDDGDTELGTAWPSPRFTDNGDGTVTDRLTGLIWLEDAGCLGSGDWGVAFAQVASLNSGGITTCANFTAPTFDDWRLPNVRELESLLHYKYTGPALGDTAGTGQWSQDDPFLNVESGYYWSSDEYAGLSIGFNAWYVTFSDGRTSPTGKPLSQNVWAVRGGR